MININNVTISGNLTRDPELRFTQNETPVCQFNIAHNTKRGEQEEVSFFNVTAWKKTAEICAEYLTKGSPVMIEGSLKQRSWNDNDGNKRSVIEITAWKVHFLGGKKQEGEQEEQEEVPF